MPPHPSTLHPISQVSPSIPFPPPAWNIFPPLPNRHCKLNTGPMWDLFYGFRKALAQTYPQLPTCSPNIRTIQLPAILLLPNMPSNILRAQNHWVLPSLIVPIITSNPSLNFRFSPIKLLPSQMLIGGHKINQIVYQS